MDGRGVLGVEDKKEIALSGSDMVGGRVAEVEAEVVTEGFSNPNLLGGTLSRVLLLDFWLPEDMWLFVLVEVGVMRESRIAQGRSRVKLREVSSFLWDSNACAKLAAFDGESSATGPLELLKAGRESIPAWI